MIFKREKSFFRFCFPVFVVIVSLYFSVIAFTPSQMTVLAGEEYRVEFFHRSGCSLQLKRAGYMYRNWTPGTERHFSQCRIPLRVLNTDRTESN
ncbi:hypothetical protein ODU73_002068 [Thermoclostridium stercorarium]|uniref:hypothetical protein n=1 Tax=Thermoclostridium stercorarium TaxID=1510 RepID=UPI002248C913|nr:hypothetical protein [Thermoclostridium stercorarium]UZQ84978.1 hypothetical protein ODU73_002068 [Thermoclostridium stercorarium]